MRTVGTRPIADMHPVTSAVSNVAWGAKLHEQKKERDYKHLVLCTTSYTCLSAHARFY